MEVAEESVLMNEQRLTHCITLSDHLWGNALSVSKSPTSDGNLHCPGHTGSGQTMCGVQVEYLSNFALLPCQVPEGSSSEYAADQTCTL